MPDQIEKNLILLLDQSGRTATASWRFLRQGEPGRCLDERVVNGGSSPVVHCFERHQLIEYLYLALRVKLSTGKTMARRVLYLHDGNLSSMFYTEANDAYSVFASLFLPPVHGLAQRVRRWLPPLLKADRRFIAVLPVECAAASPSLREQGLPAGQNFMFFSNANGKLLLTSGETLCRGKGQLYKTTANQAYAEVMRKEFRIMSSVEADGNADLMPKTSSWLAGGWHGYFPEEFVHGHNLRKILRATGHSMGATGFCTYLDRLDGWFQGFAATFQGERQSLTACYADMLAAFSSRYGSETMGRRIQESARSFLCSVDATHGGIRSGTAHNDLWPGNFVVRGDRLVAVDWERGAEKRAPMFDYFWMIISAAMEYYVSLAGRCDYSRAYRLLLAGGDEVACSAEEKLRTFLCSMDFEQGHYHHFMLLFLMEWSVQGEIALGEQTAMDSLAYEELLAFFAGHVDCRHDDKEPVTVLCNALI